MIDLTCPITNIAPLVPHSGEMILLDRITEFSPEHLIAETEIRSDNLLLRNGKLASFIGAEILAQGIAAWAGCKCTLAGVPIGLGYWLGSRKLHLYQQEIDVGTQLQIRVKMSIEDATGFGVFDCQLVNLNTQEPIIEGVLNVFTPKESKEPK